MNFQTGHVLFPIKNRPFGRHAADREEAHKHGFRQFRQKNEIGRLYALTGNDVLQGCFKLV